MLDVTKDFKFNDEDYSLQIKEKSPFKLFIEVAKKTDESENYTLDVNVNDFKKSDELSFIDNRDQLVQILLKGVSGKKATLVRGDFELDLVVPSVHAGESREVALKLFRNISSHFGSGKKNEMKKLLAKRQLENTSKSNEDKQDDQLSSLMDSHRKAKDKLAEMQTEISDLRNRETYLRKQYDKKREDLETANLPCFIEGRLEEALLTKWLPKHIKRQLVYKATEEGFSAFAFHKHCDEVGPTLTVITLDDKTKIGGFTPCSWSSSILGKFGVDDMRISFVFNLTKGEKFPLVYENYSNYSHKNCGPCFGGDWRGKLIFPFKSYRHDIFICSDSNEESESSIGFPYCYQESYFSKENKLFNKEERQFTVHEIEVYRVELDL